MHAGDVYRALLRCYPASFRDEYGAAMVDAFESQLRDAGARRARAAIWIRTLYDIPFTAPKEHLHVILQDLRQAVRILIATPGFTVVAVLLLALGIGANAAIFSLVNNVMMSTLPVRNPHELVMLTNPDARGVSLGSEGGDRSLLTYAEFRQLQDRTATTFVSLMASQSATSNVRARIAGAEPETVTIRLVSASYFATLGVPAIEGRTFVIADDTVEGAAPYAVISDDFWRRRFGGRADIVGQPIAINGTVFSVIGVTPASFFGETIGERPDAWLPLTMQLQVMPGRDYLHERPGDVEKAMWLHAFGRLRPGATLEAAKAEANLAFQQELAAYYGAAALSDRTRTGLLDQHLVLRPAATGASALRGTFGEPLLVLLAAAALVLLIACANLGNLLLARTTARQREIAVRLALGASRGRLIRQLVTESLCLASLGGIAGLATAILLRDGLLQLMPDTIALPPAIDIRVLGFVFGLTLAAGVILGVLPALRITSADPASGLKEQSRGIVGAGAWLRIGRLVVIGQLALSLPLLVGADMLVRTLGNLQNADVGYAKERLLVVSVDAQAARYDATRQAMAIDRLLDRVRAIPGVGAATYSNNGLFANGDNGDQLIVEGYSSPQGRQPSSRYDQIGPAYFSTLGIPIRMGREITAQDLAAGHNVCVLNEAFVKRFFAGRNPIGLHVTQTYANQRHLYEVVGVVADSRQNRLRGDIETRFYVPATQPAAGIATMSFLIRPTSAPGAVLTELRRAIEQAEPNMDILHARPLAEAIDQRIVQDRLLGQLSMAFGVVALLLAAIGLYGLLSYGVARRTNEIGIRKALGAQPRALIAMILRETSWLLVAGLIAGSAVAAAGIRLITSRLYGVSASDPIAFATSMTILTMVAVLATWLPAWRASRVDPLAALRYE